MLCILQTLQYRAVSFSLSARAVLCVATAVCKMITSRDFAGNAEHCVACDFDQGAGMSVQSKNFRCEN